MKIIPNYFECIAYSKASLLQESLIVDNDGYESHNREILKLLFNFLCGLFITANEMRLVTVHVLISI